MKSKENRVILLGTLLKRTVEEDKELEELLIEKLDWAYIVGQLFHHRISGYFYYALGEELSKYVMPEFYRSLHLLVKAQEISNKERMDKLMIIFKEFEKEEISYAALKGVSYYLTMYPFGIRRSNDSDILVLEEDLKKVDKILLENGFYQSGDKGKTVAGKREKMIQIMNYHDLIPYYLPMQSEYQELLKLDINFRLDSTGNDMTKKAYKYGTKIVEKVGYVGRILDDRIQFIQLCVHFYREASNSLWVSKKRDLLLYKLVDIENTIRYLGNEVIQASIDKACELELEKQIYFTFFYLKEFYGSMDYDKFLKNFAFENLDFLYTIHMEGEDRDVVRERNFVEETFDLYITNADYLKSKDLL